MKHLSVLASSLLLCLAVVSAAPATAPTEPTVTAADLPRVPATEPNDALQTFKVRPGFNLELAACEPEVVDPIAICFDENGRLFVVEMIDYSERREERLSRIRLLEDADDDGRYEKSTVFLDNLAWATALFWYDGGLLVGATPDILYAKDTNGDGVADTREVLFTGFANTQDRVNVQGLFNNFNWGLDNRIHGCSGVNGGLVTQTRHPDREPIDVKGKGFVIDPRDWSLTTEHGGGQYGLSYDHTGRLFTCSNSVHIETFIYDARYAGRNAHAALPPPRICPAVDGPAAEVFRASPEEPWRVIRTRWRIAGLVPGVVEGGGRSAGYFTGATGVTVYRGDAFGPEFVGNAFTGDAGGNLVHRKVVRPGKDGIEPVAERAADEKKIEFVASTDNWFRPVDFANGPDGALYICDMYRETIEHPWSIPPNIKQFLDLNSGNDRGRIWRVVPDGFKRRPNPKLGSASTDELVATLAHPNGWHRDTAARLLFERQDKAAVPAIEQLLEKSDAPLGRMHALYALQGLGALEESHVLRALGDADAVVREHALKLAETLEPSSAILEKLAVLADDAEPRVRYQLAWTLSVVPHPRRTQVVGQLASRDARSQWMRAAMLNALADGAGEVFAAVAAKADATKLPFLEQLAAAIGASNDADDVARVVKFVLASDQPKQSFAVARALADGGLKDTAALKDVIARAAQVASDKSVQPLDRAQAAALLAYGENTAPLAELLGERSQTIQLAALAALDRAESSELSKIVIDRWPTLSPRARAEAVTVLLKRPDRAKALLGAIKAGTVQANDVSATQAKFLRSHPTKDVRSLATAVLPDLAAQRAAVIASFQPALSLSGDATRGRATYQKLCISCHRAEGEGHAVGPDLVTVKNSGGEKLLLSILDPNREVAANFVSYLVETKDGQSVLGVVAADTPTHITVREAYGKETTLPRDKIKRMASQGLSIMPEGLEQGLSHQDVADLLQFVETLD